MAGGKYLGGKLGPEILTTMGSKITEEVAETVADITANGVFKVLGDTAENMMEDPPSNNATKKAAPSYEMGPPVGVQF